MSHLLHSSNGYHDRSWSLDNYVAPGTSDTPARVRIEKDQKLHNGDIVTDAALYTSREHSDNFSGSVAMSQLRVHTIISSSTPCYEQGVPMFRNFASLLDDNAEQELIDETSYKLSEEHQRAFKSP